MNEKVLLQVEQILDYQFRDRELLARALTHSSAVTDRILSNERLEFFGDSILGMIICHNLFEIFSDYLEGDLTKAKSMLVSRRNCARIARQLGLNEYLKVGKGMISSRALTGSLSAGLLEAVIAAIYIDGGLEAAREFILRVFAQAIEQAQVEQYHGNFKSLLQQYSQQHFNKTPVYELLDEKGPDHNKCFEVQGIVNGKRFASAWGTNKKEAEQKAALNALAELGILKNIGDMDEDD